MKQISALSFRMLLLLGAIFIASCDEDSFFDPDPNTDDIDAAYSFGWNGEDDLESIPTSTNFGFGSGNLPSSVDLVPKFPPIGDQGQYGTCVSWAVAYNMKTAINGMNRGLSSTQLSAAANQFSPKDLFIAIPDGQKGANCGGTNFSDALNVLQDRGVASMQTVPYTALGDCSRSNLQSSWSNEASQHKIKYWRKIDPTVQSIKQNLSNNIPIVLGARLSDNFMSWNSDIVISSSTSYNTVGQHAYHAMVIAGYDDARGGNGAFKVINSWGEFWGDRGYIWVDYNYMINEFCTSYNGDKPLFMAADEEADNTPPDNSDPTVSGVDLAPWIFSDISTAQNSGIETERLIDFNVYNIGNETASPNADWSFYYIYFNAYDANDYGVLFYDNFNTSAAPNNFYCPTSFNCVFNYPIRPGENFSQNVWGWSSVARTYYMPEITGYYYLVLIADTDDKFAELDELNNLFYTTADPKYFNDGYGLSQPGANDRSQDSGVFHFSNEEKFSPQKLKDHPFNSIVSDEFKNAYTQEEILEFVKREHRNGGINNKVDEFINQSTKKPYGN